MLTYLKKFAIEIVPSVAATVIGAYIVNHYINARPASEAPKAAIASTAQPKSDAAKPAATKLDASRPDLAKADSDAETTGIPAAGVKAKGVSERAILEKNAAAEKAVVVEKPADKPAEKTADKPAETTASLPTETKRPATPRAAKAASPAQPVIAAAPADAAAVTEERRDANDLARAAIERLRSNGESAKRAPEAPRAPEVARAPEPPHVAPPPAPLTVGALPPPIIVASPPESAPYNAAARVEDPLRPTPPADIPLARPPLDLRAEAVAEPPKQKTNIAEDMLSTAKSMFHSVLPK
jgi:hypothetical protein